MEDEDVDIDDLDFVPPRKPSPSNIAPVDVKRLLNDKTYRQALPTPKATSNRFRNRLHKMPPYNFRLCFENNSCPELPSATTMERGGWFHVGWLNGRMAFCTYNFAAMPRGATVTTATSPVLILTSWGTEGKAVRLSDHSPAFKLVQNWSTLEFPNSSAVINHRIDCRQSMAKSSDVWITCGMTVMLRLYRLR